MKFVSYLQSLGSVKINGHMNTQYTKDNYFTCFLTENHFEHIQKILHLESIHIHNGMDNFSPS